MIALPKWVGLGITGVYGLYTVSRAIAGIASGVSPIGTVSATAVFVVAFFTCSYLPAGRVASVVVPWFGLIAAIAVPLLVTPGLDPDGSYSSGAWHVDAVACLATVLLMRGRLLFAVGACGALIVQTVAWAGPVGLLDYAVLAVLLVFAVAAAASVAIRAAETELRRYGSTEKETIAWQAAQEAYHIERRDRLLATGRTAEAMLRRIASTAGHLDDGERAECRVLEQTIRDEIRGRRLLNDAVRTQVVAHRRRSALVQVHDDGGLDGVPDADVDRMLLEVASALAPLTSNRIVIRTAPRDSATAITVVASSVDPVAAALGIDDDETLDLWFDLERPVAVPA